MASSKKLTVPILEGFSGDCPPQQTLFWEMWTHSKAYAIKSLKTSYIQDIKKGKLNPQTYGYSTVNDAYYLFRRADDYGEAARRATDAKLKDYFLKREKIYNDQKKRFVKKWHIKDASSVPAIQVCLATRC